MRAIGGADLPDRAVEAAQLGSRLLHELRSLSLTRASMTSRV